MPKGLANDRVLNLVGSTQLPDVFGILEGAQILLGADSMAIHMASLVGTPTLNISFSSVRFWETGPRAKGSRVLWFFNNLEIDVQQIVEEALLMITHKPPSHFSIEKVETFGIIYSLHGYHENEFSWELTRALYLNHAFPTANSKTIRTGFVRLGELASLGLEQIARIRNPQKQTVAVGILDEIDSMIDQIAHLVPDISPVVRWFQTEKLRIGPIPIDDLIKSTRGLFEKLREICQIYELTETFNESLFRGDLTWKS